MTNSSGSFISVVGTYKVDPDDASAFASIAADSVLTTTRKPGCIYYIASRDVVEPGIFHLTEGWADQAALDAHSSSPDFQEMLAKAMRLRILGREIFVSESKGRTLVS